MPMAAAPGPRGSRDPPKRMKNATTNYIKMFVAGALAVRGLESVISLPPVDPATTSLFMLDAPGAGRLMCSVGRRLKWAGFDYL